MLRTLLALVLSVIAAAVSAQMSNRQLLDAAGNSEYLRIVAALEPAGLAKLPTAARAHALCFAYARLKRYTRLAGCLDELEARIKKGDTETLLLGLDDATPELQMMRAALHIDLGRHDDGALEAARALDSPLGRRAVERDVEINALSLMVVGNALAGNRSQAEQQLGLLEKIRAGASALGRNDLTTVKSIALGRAYIALGRHADAIRAIQSDRSFAFKAAIDNALSGASARDRNAWRWQELPRLFIVSYALLRSGRVAEAKVAYDRLLAVPETRQNGEIHWNALFDRGAIAEQEGDLDAAINFYRRAIEVLEEQRSSIINETSKLGFLRDKQEPFERIVRLLLDPRFESRGNDVFDFIERSKSRAMLDLLAGRVTFNEPMLAAVDPSPARPTESRDRAQIQVAAFRAFAAKNAAAGVPVKSSLPDNVDPETDFAISTLPAPRIAAALKPREAVVQYFLGSDYLAIAVLTAERCFAVRRPVGTLRADVFALRRLASSPHATVDAVAALTRRVHATLVAPVENEIRGRRLTIVPHGPLHYVPFAALESDATGKILIEEHVLRVLPSASLAGVVDAPRPAGNGSLLVFGNPTLDLPGAENEAKRIATLSAGARLYLREAATRNAFVREAPRSARIHVAAHAKFLSDRPLESALLFAPTAQDNGILTARDLYRLDLDADLIVLSACETGVSDVQKGDELVGLLRGFLYAGARSIVATLWDIEDEAAATFGLTFYRSLATMDKAAALREAVLSVRKKFPEPIFWAPYFLTGNG